MGTKQKVIILLALVILALIVLAVFGMAGSAFSGLGDGYDKPPRSPDDSSGASLSATMRIGESVSLLGVTIAPLSVTEDSRCPADVVCVWAGTVRVRASLESSAGRLEKIVALNTPEMVGEQSITLTAVEPLKISEGSVSPAEYRLTFRVTNK